MRPMAAITVRKSRTSMTTTLVTDSATISTLYDILERIEPVALDSKNRVGKVRNLPNTSRRNALMTLRPIQPSDASVAKPVMPRAMNTRTKATGSQRVASRFCATRASSMSGSTMATRLISMTAVNAIATSAMTPIVLCGNTYCHSRR